MKVASHSRSIQVFEYPDGVKALYLTAALTDELADFIARERFDRLVVERYMPWRLKHPDCLADVVTELWIEDRKTPPAIIDGFPGLTSLHAAIPATDLPVSMLSKLRECELSHQTRIPPDLASCRRLRTLGLFNCSLKELGVVTQLGTLERLTLGSVKVPTLEGVGQLSHLRHVGITRAPVSDLTFVRGCVRLESLSLSFLPKLTSLRGIEGLPKLRDFNLANARSLADLGPLKGLKGLRRVLFESCPELKSLEPLLPATVLEKLHLWESTSVADGKLRQVLSLPKLREFVFRNRKHYDLNQEDAKEALRSRRQDH